MAAEREGGGVRPAQDEMKVQTSCVAHGVLWSDTAAPLPLPPAQTLVEAFLQEVHDSMCRGVQGKGHEEGVEEIQSEVVDLGQSLQQALQIPTVHLTVT